MTNPLSKVLAPKGVLRVGINLGNFLLVTGKDERGDPTGVAPDMARAIAAALNLSVQLIPFQSPGAIADTARDDIWDIGLIGDEPERRKNMDFTSPYVEIEATYLVPATSPFHDIQDIDAPGVRISVEERAAFELWLTRNIAHATVVHTQGFEAAHKAFLSENLEALAGLRPGLLNAARTMKAVRILDGKFTSVQQAIGTPKGRNEAFDFLEVFVEASKRSGLVAQLIARHNVEGLAVAPVKSA